MAIAPQKFRPQSAPQPEADRRLYDDRRGSSAQRGYGAAWRRARQGYLLEHPLCVECLRQGVSEPATVVDHVIPHRGDAGLFWDCQNWQSLCESCHNSWKQAQERAERDRGPKSLRP